MNKKLCNLHKKTEIQILTNFTELLTDYYASKTTPEYRKKKGQFFTPKLISEFMVKQFSDFDKKENIRILDPGAGIGIFESAICDILKSSRKSLKISFDLYENDLTMLPLLDHNMNICKKVMIKNGFKIAYQIHNDDFILSNSSIFNDKSNEFDFNRNGYDFIICNPPYYKLKRDAPQAIKMNSIIKGQPNIYSLFMALSAKLLKNNGQITIITPRSYCSGLYFKEFRKWFFRIIRPIRIHIFKSRKEVFKKYNVLQEMIILTAVKSSEIPKNIILSSSKGESIENKNLIIRKIPYKKIISYKNDDIIMKIPESKMDEHIGAKIDRLKLNLDILGLKISTGPVVPFRVGNYFLNDINKGHDKAPLIWMQNIIDRKVIWPIGINNKSIAIEKNKDTIKLLIKNGNYILVKRFSSKEGKRRINAGILLETTLSSDYIGIENHVNYIHRIDGKLTENEVHGIAALLNSKLYNRYFQMINGSTQVNASEIRVIPLPSLEKIRLIGSLVKKLKEYDEIRNEKIIGKELNIDKNILSSLIREG